jgi:RNA polymerase sigma factor (sigma-70 family)
MAAHEYELLRRRLIIYFAGRGSASPEDLADETLDRVADRMEKGEVTLNLPNYCFGVARWILMKSIEASGRKVSFDDLPAIAFDLTPEADLLHEELDKQKLDCLERCLRELKEEDREFVTLYYGPVGDRDKSRKALAAELGMSYSAMRVRASRLIARLNDCVRHCMEEK